MEIIQNMPIWGWLLIAIFLISFLIQIYFYFFVFGKISFFKERKKKVTDNKPPVSIVVCARNESENLAKNIPLLFAQDYPEFQVIVVNDCSEDDTETELKLLQSKYPELYVTTINADPKFKHGKKLALTIGIKAAKHEYLLFTDADCAQVSNKWIELMMRNYTEGVDFVIGVSPFIKQKGALNRILSFENLFIAIQYIGFALAKMPYMSVGRNMSYRKTIFFKNKGFSNHAHLLSGDDDLFINKLANKHNLRVEISKESRVMTESPSSFLRYRIQKKRHLQAGEYYKFKDLFFLMTEQFTRFSLIASAIALIFFKILPFIALGIFVLKLIIQGIIINTAASKMGFRRFYVSFIWYDYLIPIINFFLAISVKMQPSKIKWK